MRNLILKGNLEGKECTPDVMFYFEKGECFITGECYPTDTELEQMFEDMTTWLKNYFDIKNQLTFHINLHYFNSLSEKKLAELISYLDIASLKGKCIDLKWSIHKDDTSFKEDIEDILRNVNLNFDLLEV